MGGFICVEDESRASGIRVNTTDQRQLGDRISASGILTIAPNGELQLDQATTIFRSYSDLPLALGMNNRSLGGGAFGLQAGVSGGVGLNNIGLLVKAWGRVTEVDPVSPPAWFKIDDGSGRGIK